MSCSYAGYLLSSSSQKYREQISATSSFPYSIGCVFKTKDKVSQISPCFHITDEEPPLPSHYENFSQLVYPTCLHAYHVSAIFMCISVYILF